MASKSATENVNDAVPVGSTYVSLHRWPQAEVDFLRSISGSATSASHARPIDSISCRQMFLRSYKFSRQDEDDKEEEEVAETNCNKDDAKKKKKKRGEGKPLTGVMLRSNWLGLGKKTRTVFGWKMVKRWLVCAPSRVNASADQ